MTAIVIRRAFGPGRVRPGPARERKERNFERESAEVCWPSLGTLGERGQVCGGSLGDLGEWGFPLALSCVPLVSFSFRLGPFGVPLPSFGLPLVSFVSVWGVRLFQFYVPSRFEGRFRCIFEYFLVQIWRPSREGKGHEERWSKLVGGGPLVTAISEVLLNACLLYC